MKRAVKSFSVFFVIATFVIVSASFIAPAFLSTAKAFGFGDLDGGPPQDNVISQTCGNDKWGVCADFGCAKANPGFECKNSMMPITDDEGQEDNIEVCGCSKTV